LGAKRIILEVAVAFLEGAVAAQEAGADRLEVNAALELGGLTPSLGLVREIASAVSLPLIVMLRPRGAGFTYSTSEFRTMLRDCEIALANGASGVTFGILRPDHQIDVDRCRELVRLAGTAQTVFHRAFDLMTDQSDGLERLIDLGVTRVLTSGGQTTALEGTSWLAELRRRAGGRIEILPGGAIGPENVRELIRGTGCDQVHGSFSEERTDEAGQIARNRFRQTSAARVAAVRGELDRLL
jgi:copper homeostasis protein